jgi:glutamate synthase domain-containing protein 3
MVDLEELSEPGEAAELRALVEEHARETGSRRAARILAEWEGSLSRIIKVMPREYRRALAALAAETAA